MGLDIISIESSLTLTLALAAVSALFNASVDLFIGHSSSNVLNGRCHSASSVISFGNVSHALSFFLNLFLCVRTHNPLVHLR